MGQSIVQRLRKQNPAIRRSWEQAADKARIERYIRKYAKSKQEKSVSYA